MVQVKRVKNLGKGYYLFTIDSVVDSIKSDLGERSNEFESFFAKMKDGEWVEVWGVRTSVPKLTDLAFRIR